MEHSFFTDLFDVAVGIFSGWYYFIDLVALYPRLVKCLSVKLATLTSFVRFPMYQWICRTGKVNVARERACLSSKAREAFHLLVSFFKRMKKQMIPRPISTTELYTYYFRCLNGGLYNRHASVLSQHLFMQIWKLWEGFSCIIWMVSVFQYCQC